MFALCSMRTTETSFRASSQLQAGTLSQGAGSRGVKPNFSKRDFGLVRRLMEEGYADAEIVEAMRPMVEAECAQRLWRRKSRIYLDYTVRAVERAAFRGADAEAPNPH